MFNWKKLRQNQTPERDEDEEESRGRQDKRHILRESRSLICINTGFNLLNAIIGRVKRVEEEWEAPSSPSLLQHLTKEGFRVTWSSTNYML